MPPESGQRIDRVRQQIRELESELVRARSTLHGLLAERTGDVSEYFGNWTPPPLLDPASMSGVWIENAETGRGTASGSLGAILGLTSESEELDREEILDRLSPGDRTSIEGLYECVGSGTRCDPVRVRIQRPGAEPREVLFQLHRPTGSREGSLVGALLDLTDVLRTEAFSYRQHEHFRLTQSIAGVGSWVYDARTEAVEWSPELYRIFGVEPDVQPTRDLFRSLVHPADLEIVEHAERQFAKEGTAPPHEYRILRANDGGLRHVLTSGAPLRDRGNAILGFLGTTIDVTSRKELEARVAEAVKMEALGRLAGGVAHDFNNLLTVIQGFSALLAKREPHDELERIDEAAEAAGRLTQRLLQFSRQSVVTPEPLDVNAMIHHSMSLLERIIGEDIAIELDLAEDLWSVTADKGQLEQILFNLCANSRDALPDGGSLRIVTRNRPRSALGVEAIEMTIEDDGQGMPPEVAANAFEPFFTTKERSKGTGLGLSTVFGVVTQSGGEISLHSAIGEGTRIEILLPRTRRPASDTRHPVVRATKAGPLLVLVVEDEPRIAELLHQTLAEAGHQVMMATRPGLAVERFQAATDNIDLLITDVVMPEMSGPALAARLRALHPELRVLFISGYPAGELDLGPHHQRTFLAKPFSSDQLLGAVERIAGGRPIPAPDENPEPPSSSSAPSGV